ncbi:uncharacterized protein LOC116576697 [Mustela erminea]|uniref:uncharacterized protein LOC116576697 n=1 Tax=Mustela erminea TaxID=36723 RepID=UPI001386E834|nr:uncharacterized protein LOC116576697 [Mustela erminea]
MRVETNRQFGRGCTSVAGKRGRRCLPGRPGSAWGGAFPLLGGAGRGGAGLSGARRPWSPVGVWFRDRAGDAAPFSPRSCLPGLVRPRAQAGAPAPRPSGQAKARADTAGRSRGSVLRVLTRDAAVKRNRRKPRGFGYLPPASAGRCSPQLGRSRAESRGSTPRSGAWVRSREGPTEPAIGRPRAACGLRTRERLVASVLRTRVDSCPAPESRCGSDAPVVRAPLRDAGSSCRTRAPAPAAGRGLRLRLRDADSGSGCGTRDADSGSGRGTRTERCRRRSRPAGDRFQFPSVWRKRSARTPHVKFIRKLFLKFWVNFKHHQ